MLCLKTLRRLSRTESGVTAIEYAIIASLIAVMIIGAVSLIGADLTRTFDTVAGSFPSSTGDDPDDFPDPCEEGGSNCGGSN